MKQITLITFISLFLLNATLCLGFKERELPHLQRILKGPDVFQIVPNPGNGIFTVTFKSETRGNIMLSVSDATGKYVYLKSIKDFNGELKELVELTGQPRGVYIFEVETDLSREAKKVILQ